MVASSSLPWCASARRVDSKAERHIRMELKLRRIDKIVVGALPAQTLSRVPPRDPYAGSEFGPSLMETSLCRADEGCLLGVWHQLKPDSNRISSICGNKWLSKVLSSLSSVASRVIFPCSSATADATVCLRRAAGQCSLTQMAGSPSCPSIYDATRSAPAQNKLSAGLKKDSRHRA